MKPESDTKREKLPDEIYFDKAVYGGISYLAQAATGIVLSYWLKHGSGRKYFDSMTKWVGSALYKSKPIEEAMKAAERPTIVTTMIAVGTSFLLPVKWLENRKPEIVKWLHDRRIGKEETAGHEQTAEEKTHDDKCLQDLASEPKQTWGSLLGGRVFSLAVVYASLFAMSKPNVWIENKSIDVIQKGLSGVGLKSLAKSKTLDQYLHIGFLDVFYSMISAGGLYVYSHYIRPPKKNGAEPEVAQVADSEAIPSPITPLLIEAEMASEQKKPKQKFSEGVKPRPLLKAEPSELYTKRVRSEELHQDALSWDRSQA